MFHQLIKLNSPLIHYKTLLNNNNQQIYKTRLINIKRKLHLESKKKQGGTKSFVKGILYLEIGIFVGSYLLWKRMNDSQEFRHFLHQNLPTVLEGYSICFMKYLNYHLIK